VIIAYTGPGGSGKSLSALDDYVLPELRRGRHVFCNISGLDPLMISWKLSTRDNIVSTRYVNRYLHRFSMSFSDDEAPLTRIFKKRLSDGSFYYANMEGLSLLLAEVMSFKVKGEEPVVIIDECHEYLNSSYWKTLEPFKRYVSMCRHYGHDLVLITQHISDVWEPLLKRVHETHDFSRGKSGFRTQYQEHVYYGSNILKEPAYTRQRFNDKSLYALYRSRDDGAEEHLSYVSIWRNKKVVAFIVGIPLLIFFGVWNIKDGIFPDANKKPSSSSSSAEVSDFSRHFSGSNVIYVKYVTCELSLKKSILS